MTAKQSIGNAWPEDLAALQPTHMPCSPRGGQPNGEHAQWAIVRAPTSERGGEAGAARA